jgi:hypothetical protein
MFPDMKSLRDPTFHGLPGTITFMSLPPLPLQR